MGVVKEIVRKQMLLIQRFLGVDTVLERLASIQDIYIPATIQHQKIFPKYQGIHKNQDIVICCTGPTFEYYKPIKGAIHIAINAAIYREDIDYQYIFYSDYNDYVKRDIEYIKRNKTEAIKFYNLNSCPNRHNDMIPLKYRDKTVETYYVDSYDYTNRGFNFNRTNKFYFHPDISIAPIKSYGTTALAAFQVALWMRPKRIFLVGADCSTGHAGGLHYEYEDSVIKSDFNYVVKVWKELKEFASNYYEDVKIISINPVGLKRVFTDKYTENYKCSIRQEKRKNRKSSC